MNVILSWLDSRAADRVLRVAMVLSALAVLWLGYRQERIEACNQRYNEATAKVNRARSDAADRRAAALAEAMRASLVSGPAYLSAAQAYLDAQAKEDETRKENPLVDPPSNFCG